LGAVVRFRIQRAVLRGGVAGGTIWADHLRSLVWSEPSHGRRFDDGRLPALYRRSRIGAEPASRGSAAPLAGATDLGRFKFGNRLSAICAERNSVGRGQRGVGRRAGFDETGSLAWIYADFRSERIDRGSRCRTLFRPAKPPAKSAGTGKQVGVVQSRTLV